MVTIRKTFPEQKYLILTSASFQLLTRLQSSTGREEFYFFVAGIAVRSLAKSSTSIKNLAKMLNQDLLERLTLYNVYFVKKVALLRIFSI